MGTPSQARPKCAETTSKRTLITRKAAHEALPTLVGMSVNYSTDFDRHDVRMKCGTVTRAWIENDAVMIEGFLFTVDCPDVVSRVREEESEFGFSFDSKECLITNMNAEVYEINKLFFTGATLIYKHKAAYRNTSITLKED